MYSRIKKSISILLFSISAIQPLVAATSTTECDLLSTEEYMRVGDVDSKEIFTRIDYLYECNITTDKQGPCEKWESKDEDYNASYRTDVTFKSEDFSGSSTELFNLVSAFNGVQYIWGGWKGICTDGTIVDFSWASDPLYWASLALQAFGDEIGTAAGLEKDALKYAQCATQAAIGVGGILMEHYDDSEVPCDPVDEFCGENDADSPDNIISMDQQSWIDALSNNPELRDYTTVVSSSEGVVVVRFTPQDTNGMLPVDADAEAEKAKEMMLVFKGVVVAANAGICVGSVALGGEANAVASTPQGQSATSPAAILTNLVGRLDPITGAILNVALQLASSFQSIDTCNKKDDAEDKGSRHLKTYSHKEYGMCHLYRTEKNIDSSPFTDYDNYHYCCYPDVVSRILVEQIKAQLARGWSHCTDITFKDIEKVNFQTCTQDQINDPGAVDGKNIKWDAAVSEREESFQFKYKCIDYTDLSEYMKDRVGEGVDNFMFEEQLNRLQEGNFTIEEKDVEIITAT